MTDPLIGIANLIQTLRDTYKDNECFFFQNEQKVLELVDRTLVLCGRFCLMNCRGADTVRKIIEDKEEGLSLLELSELHETNPDEILSSIESYQTLVSQFEQS